MQGALRTRVRFPAPPPGFVQMLSLWTSPGLVIFMRRTKRKQYRKSLLANRRSQTRQVFDEAGSTHRRFYPRNSLVFPSERSMHYVYILKSQKDDSKHYVGITDNLDRRLGQHNKMPTNSYTKKYGPWLREIYIAFKDKQRAERFEIYLKSHSGRAFLKRHLI